MPAGSRSSSFGLRGLRRSASSPGVSASSPGVSVGMSSSKPRRNASPSFAGLRRLIFKKDSASPQGKRLSPGLRGSKGKFDREETTVGAATYIQSIQRRKKAEHARQMADFLRQTRVGATSLAAESAAEAAVAAAEAAASEVTTEIADTARRAAEAAVAEAEAAAAEVATAAAQTVEAMAAAHTAARVATATIVAEAEAAAAEAAKETETTVAEASADVAAKEAYIVEAAAKSMMVQDEAVGAAAEAMTQAQEEEVGVEEEEAAEVWQEVRGRGGNGQIKEAYIFWQCTAQCKE